MFALGTFALGTEAVPSSPARSATATPSSVVGTVTLHGSEFTLSETATPPTLLVTGTALDAAPWHTATVEATPAQGNFIDPGPSLIWSGTALPFAAEGTFVDEGATILASATPPVGTLEAQGVADTPFVYVDAAALPATLLRLGNLPSPTILYAIGLITTTVEGTGEVAADVRVSSTAVDARVLADGTTFTPSITADLVVYPPTLVRSTALYGTALPVTRTFPGIVVGTGEIPEPGLPTSDAAMPATVTGTWTGFVPAISGTLIVLPAVLDTDVTLPEPVLRVEFTTATPQTVTGDSVVYTPTILNEPIALPSVIVASGDIFAPDVITDPSALVAAVEAEGIVYTPNLTPLTFALPPSVVGQGDVLDPTVTATAFTVPAVLDTGSEVYQPYVAAVTATAMPELLQATYTAFGATIAVEMDAFPVTFEATSTIFTPSVFNINYVDTVEMPEATGQVYPATFEVASYATEVEFVDAFGTLPVTAQVNDMTIQVDPLLMTRELPDPFVFSPSRVIRPTVTFTHRVFPPTFKRDSAPVIQGPTATGAVLSPAALPSILAAAGPVEATWEAFDASTDIFAFARPAVLIRRGRVQVPVVATTAGVAQSPVVQADGTIFMPQPTSLVIVDAEDASIFGEVPVPWAGATAASPATVVAHGAVLAPQARISAASGFPATVEGQGASWDATGRSTARVRPLPVLGRRSLLLPTISRSRSAFPPTLVRRGVIPLHRGIPGITATPETVVRSGWVGDIEVVWFTGVPVQPVVADGTILQPLVLPVPIPGPGTQPGDQVVIDFERSGAGRLNVTGKVVVVDTALGPSGRARVIPARSGSRASGVGTGGSARVTGAAVAVATDGAGQPSGVRVTGSGQSGSAEGEGEGIGTNVKGEPSPRVPSGA